MGLTHRREMGPVRNREASHIQEEERRRKIKGRIFEKENRRKRIGI